MELAGRQKRLLPRAMCVVAALTGTALDRGMDRANAPWLFNDLIVTCFTKRTGIGSEEAASIGGMGGVTSTALTFLEGAVEPPGLTPLYHVAVAIEAQLVFRFVKELSLGGSVRIVTGTALALPSWCVHERFFQLPTDRIVATRAELRAGPRAQSGLIALVGLVTIDTLTRLDGCVNDFRRAPCLDVLVAG